MKTNDKTNEDKLKKLKDKAADPKIKEAIDKKLKYVNNQFNK